MSYHIVLMGLVFHRTSGMMRIPANGLMPLPLAGHPLLGPRALTAGLQAFSLLQEQIFQFLEFISYLQERSVYTKFSQSTGNTGENGGIYLASSIYGL